MLLIMLTAQAWEPGATTSWPGSYQGGALRPGQDQVALATFDTLTLRDPTTDGIFSTHARGGGPLAWLPDGSAIVHCGAGGTFLVPVVGDVFGAEEQLSASSCSVALPTASGVVIVSGSDVQRVDADGAVSTGLTGDVVGVRGDDLLITDFNATTAVASDGSIVDFGIPLERLAGSADGWFGSDNQTVVFLPDGEPAETLLFSGGVAGTGDLDGDGLPDAVGYSNDGGAWVYESVSSAVRLLPNTDLGAYGSFVPAVEDCASLLAVESGYHWTPPVACHGDADGDGSTTEQGDCDDSDGARGPQATEVCDRIDDDCDGTFTDVPFAPDPVIDALEGTDAFLELTVCPELAAEVTVGDPCFISSTTVVCDNSDDASYTVELRLGDQVVELDVTIRNALPEFTNDVTVPRGEVTVVELAIFDLGMFDTHSFALIDGPTWVELENNGRLTVDAPRKVGEHPLSVAVTDDDGGRTEDVLVLRISDPPEAVRGCDACSLSGLAPVGFMGWLGMLVARRRRQP